ncbi:MULTISPECIES: hypothetical protein [Serratia]|uniref:Colicin V n=1 Tax=Serratia fonticola TaxID=47917 RepID=A0AAE7JV40_SERFO|nr:MULTISPECIES: hypothetical protein [Serratia]AYM93303.1 hypothetical protein D9980_23565 [Serratia sp. 3ACOL1]MDK2376545.1 hypothetical protein [Serratia fonticola]QKJ60790.1 hypothetical protein G9399_24025 [Serratia fonticola]
MRELNIMEVEMVSGAGFFSRIAAAAVGAFGVATTGMMKVGVAGGSTGGILGVGVISALVGVVLGGVFGAMQGAIYGFTNDWDKTISAVNSSTEEWLGQGSIFPKV